MGIATITADMGLHGPDDDHQARWWRVAYDRAEIFVVDPDDRPFRVGSRLNVVRRQGEPARWIWVFGNNHGLFNPSQDPAAEKGRREEKRRGQI